MIITRTPLRISFSGGGTDLPSFFLKNGGCVLSSTIDKYVYISANDSFDELKTILKYSEIEQIWNVNHIRHPIIRESMRKYNISGIELNSTSDVPAKTGMGSSSSFTVGILNAFRRYSGLQSTPQQLADEACDLEINVLKENIGYQDQYAAAYGGLNYIEFKTDGTVSIEPLALSQEEKKKMSDNLMLLHIGGTHSASEVIRSYSDDTDRLIEQKLKLCELTKRLKEELSNGNIDYLGKNLFEGWKIKKKFSNKVSNPEIDEVYEKALSNGAVGGKLLGAGGGGFLLLYVDKKTQLDIKRSLPQYPELRFDFETSGSTVIFDDNGQKTKRLP